jgi:trimeric autotransporter adhesin
MSTKTLRKRIALVAVSALTGGLFGVVSTPAANAAGLQEIVSSVAVGTVPTARAGVAIQVPVVLNLPSTMADTDTFVVGVRLLTAPATSTLASVAANPTQNAFNAGANSASVGAKLHWAVANSGSGSFGTLSAGTYSSSGNASANATYQLGSSDSTGQVTLNVNFTPDVSGTYTFVVSTPTTVLSSAAIGVYSASTSDRSTVFAVSTGTTPTSITLANISGSPAALAASVIPGAIIRATLNSPLGAGESVVITDTGSATLRQDIADATGGTATSLTLTSADFIYSGGTVAYFRVDNIAAETVTVTATGNGALPASVTASVGVTFTLSPSSPRASTVSNTGATTTTNAGLVAATASTTPALATSPAGSAGFKYITSSGSTSQTLVASLTADNASATTAIRTHWTYVDTSAKILGAKAAAVFTNTASWAGGALATAESTKTTAAALQVTGVTGSPAYESYTITLYGATTVIVSAGTPTGATLTATNGNRRVAAASTNAITFTLKDQFDAAVGNTSVTFTVAGRNGATASSTIVTNSLGQATYSLTDTGTVGTVDTITATAGSITGSATLTYGTTTVTTLDILGPNDTAANTPDTNVTLSERTGISVAVAGASAAAGRATVTVTAKDANGVVMAGVPVTFTVAGTTAAILSTTQTVFTGAAGTAATSVYAWATGSYVVTATAGGKTATSTVFFAQKDVTAARTISAVVSGGTVTATVKDRYGNVVPNVTVWATKNGTGFFGSGSSTASGTTSEAGTVDFYVNGSASVTVALGSTTAADANYGQSGSLAGFVKQGDAGVSTAVTATTVGTATTAETGIGAAFAPAGINSVTVAVEAGVSEAQTAADAAAEATDAANAATDAANAAAEAADAATAAAQDAADAVAALSTSVSAMISDLKRQITALTNLVIKIQRKVRA